MVSLLTSTSLINAIETYTGDYMFRTGEFLRLKKPIGHDANWRYRVIYATELQVCYAYLNPETGAVEHLYLERQFEASEQPERA